MSTENLKNFEFRLGRQGLLLFIVGISLLLFLVFILGVMVGMHIDAYPELVRSVPRVLGSRIEGLMRKEEAPLPHAVAVKGSTGHEERGTVSVPAIPAPVNVEGNKAPDKVENGKMLPEAAEVPPAAPTVLPPVSDLPARETSKESGADATAKRMKEQKKEAPIPDRAKAAPAPEQKTAGKYALQVVSLKEAAKAEEYCDKIKPLGYTARVVPVDLPGKGRWHRVVIEGFETRDEAQKAAEALHRKFRNVKGVIIKR